MRLARLLNLPRKAGDALVVLANASRRWHVISALYFVEHLWRDDAGLEIESLEANRGFLSLVAQEARRFSVLIDPRRTAGLGAARVG